MRLISHTCVWNDERFIRPVLDTLIECCDEVWVSISDVPWYGIDDGRRDNTEKYVREYGDSIRLLTGHWTSEHDQRNAMLDMTIECNRVSGRDPFDGYTWQMTVDADEVYDARQLYEATFLLDGIDEDLVSVPQNVYFKHGNWLVVPEDSHPPADVFRRIRPEMHFTHCRGCGYERGRMTLERDDLVVHHFNTVGTYEEVASKHRHFSHADVIPAQWLDEVWAKATIDSKNLHQLVPELLPGLRRTGLSEMPKHLASYWECMCLEGTP